MATENPQTLQQAVEFFADEDRCHAFAVAMRWPNGVACPTCGSTSVGAFSFLAKSKNPDKPARVRRIFQCREGHKTPQFTIKTGSIFEDSPITLKSWLLAMWMVTNCKNGVSSYEVHRALGITQKSAWFVLQRLRLAMQDKFSGGKLGGEVECDETFIGAKARNMHESRRRALGVYKSLNPGKVAVMGLLQRHTGDKKSRVRASVIPDTKRERLHSAVTANVAEGSTVYTDEFPAYREMPETFVHNVIRHAEFYVDGNVHTNGIENFWSLLKRMLSGTYVSVEPFHLFRYLDEETFRFNEREGNDGQRFVKVLKQAIGRRLTYKNLTAKDQEATG